MPTFEHDICRELIAMAQRLSARSDTVVDESITLLDERLGLDSLSIGDFLGSVESGFDIVIVDDEVADWLQEPIGRLALRIASAKRRGEAANVRRE
jgi:acyl carrier protein